MTPDDVDYCSTVLKSGVCTCLGCMVIVWALHQISRVGNRQ